MKKFMNKNNIITIANRSHNYLFIKFIIIASPFISLKNIGVIYSKTLTLRSWILSKILNPMDPLDNANYEKNIYFFHIGKTAGNAIAHALGQGHVPLFDKKNPKPHQEKQRQHYRIIKHPHCGKLYFYKNRNHYIFSLRNPLYRFISAFNRRSRKGKVSGYNTANDLAEALFDSCIERRKHAQITILKISHARQNMTSWFSLRLLKKFPPFFVFDQENLGASLKEFSKLIGEPDLSLFLPNNLNPKKKYSGIYDMHLSNVAIKNLNDWYFEDIAIYNYLKKQL